jgi:hypothetical protein
MFLRVTVVIGVLLLAVVAILGALRAVHDREVTRLWGELRQPVGKNKFDPQSLAALPEPAQRYLRHVIAPGTPLAASVVAQMEGRIGLEPGADKLPFRAEQILATPNGLIWRASVGDGVVRISGDDRYAAGAGGMRWYLWHVVPVMTADGPDVSRSAAGRVALEAAAMLPSALVPETGVLWQAVDEHSARVRLRVGTEESSILVVVAPGGQLERVEMMRWDSAGMDGQPGYVLWVAEALDGEQSFGGYTLPKRLRVTKRAGTPQADSFFEATITAAEFR